VGEVNDGGTRMTSTQTAQANGIGASRHTIPVIDRMMEVLGALERHAKGLTIRELTDTLALPRTTIYRILNTLQTHEVVRRSDDGAYQLGRRLLALAAHTSTRVSNTDLAAVCQPFLDRLAVELGEGIKLSVVDADGVLVLAAAAGRRSYALTVAPGQRMPIHAGAASKLLLAYQTPGVIEGWLARPLTAFTPRTITDPKRMQRELAAIRKLGWARDRGENATSIQAYAAPVFARDGTLAAALSIPFLAGTAPARMEEIKAAAIRTARMITDAIPG
jgi:DNA-binding IclR family transcriptional regulator